MKQPLIDWLRRTVGDRSAVIGLSGGVDSAVVAYLLAEAVGAERIHGCFLPSSTNLPSDAADVATIAQHLGVNYETVPIDPIVATYTAHVGELDQLAAGNLKARIRMTILYARANQRASVVVGTGNKTELLLGYFTKYGDGGVDLLPLAGLYKTEVWELARALGVPEQIVTKPPTAGLWAGQTDEAELGMTYTLADQILQAIAQGQSLAAFDQATVQNVQRRMAMAIHKLQLPPQP